MRTMTGARGKGVSNEAREFHGVRVSSANAGFALSPAEPEWLQTSTVRGDDDERSVAGYVLDPAIRFEDWSSGDEWTGRW
jgi:hypothetical protein